MSQRAKERNAASPQPHPLEEKSMSGLLMLFCVLEVAAGLATISFILNDAAQVGLALIPVVTLAGFIALSRRALTEIRYGYSSTVGGESLQGFSNLAGMLSIGIAIAIHQYGGKYSDLMAIPVIEALLLFGIGLGSVVFIRNKGEEWRREHAATTISGSAGGTGIPIGSLDPKAVQQLCDSISRTAAQMEKTLGIMEAMTANLERSNNRAQAMAASLQKGSELTQALSGQIEKAGQGVQRFDELLQHVGALVETIKKFTEV